MAGRWWQSLRARLEPLPIADALWRRALFGCPLARGLDAERQQRLRRLAAMFLARKRFHALAGAVLDDYWRLLIAMQACLPALQQGAGSLRGWRDVLIYPGEFKVRGTQHACHSSVVDIHGDTRSVDSWEHGPLVLSLADVQLDLEQPWDGYNVVLHEMAHKLDMLDGPPDGMPPLVDISRRRWVEQFDRAFRRLASSPPRDDGNPIDRRAAENASEYFAVVTELHYSQPSLLRGAEPAIAHLLEAFYGPSPAIWAEMSNAVRVLRKPAKR
ncbi:M90 family metallopeptidase [Rhodanobacter sp. BL-MT-08]